MNPAGDDLGAAIATALREHDAAELVDLPDGRRRLADVLPVARRTRRRKAIVGAVTAAAAALALIAVLALPSRHLATPPAVPDSVLSSGLPVGLLVGEVSHTHEATHKNIVEVSLLVRRDGSGRMRGPSIVGESTPVRYVSTGPGAVTIYDDNPLCAGGPDLTLRFTVSHRVVTITRAVASACSTTPEAAAELTGAMLHPTEG